MTANGAHSGGTTMSHKIKFSHLYEKMPSDISETILLDVLVVDRISERFKVYDTLIKGKNPFYSESYFKLPAGKLLILMLKSGVFLWTTIRRWTPEKETYYKSIIGSYIIIEVNDEN